MDRGSTGERDRATSALGAENRSAPLASSALLGGRGRGAGPRGAPTRARAGRGKVNSPCPLGAFRQKERG